jgi:hypothetical protein
MSSLRILVSVSLIIIFISCKKDTPVEQPLQDLLRSGGTWTISAFTQSFDTANYIGHSLIFQTDGKIEAQSSSLSRTGTWRAYGAAGDVVLLAIELEGDDFIHMESNWSIVTMTSTKLELSAGYWLPSYMTLVKN